VLVSVAHLNLKCFEAKLRAIHILKDLLHFIESFSKVKIDDLFVHGFNEGGLAGGVQNVASTARSEPLGPLK
jgi:hypothetical protein